MIRLRRIWAWCVESLRGFGPFVVCMLGGVVMAAMHDKGLGGPLVAGLLFAWALDLSSTRAAATAKAEMAGLFIKHITSGNDTTLTVEFLNKAAPNEQA